MAIGSRRPEGEATAARRADTGYVAVATALLATVLMGLLALAVDTAMWFAQGIRQQNAADAAALAGVIHLPEDPGLAASTALDLASRNDFDHGAGSVEVVAAPDTNRPTRLRVTISQTVENAFGAFLGVPTTRITRSALADYTKPPPLGSRCSQFGWPDVTTDPVCLNGGRHLVDVTATGADGSDGGEPQPEGQVFLVRVLQSGYLDLEVFDPGWSVEVACDADPALCPVDTLEAGAAKPVPADVQTVYRLRYPSPNPFDPLAGALVPQCTRDVEGYSGADASPPPDHYLQYVNICRGPGLEDEDPFVTPGVYSVQVQITAPTSGAQNRLALRATLNGDTQSVSLDAFQRASIHITEPGGGVFDVARLDSEVAGRLLAIRFERLDDGMEIRLRWPDGTPIAGCAFAGPSDQARACSVSVPESYQCIADWSGCWATMDVVTGSEEQFVLTWLAAVDGSRVRLVQE